MLKKVCAISVTCMFFAVVPASGFDFTPGKYEVTVKMEMPGMPGGMPPQTMTQCLSEQSPVPGPSPDAQGCQITDMTTSGNTVTYTMECNQQGVAAKSTGMVTYGQDSFEGTTETSMGPNAGGMTVKTAIRGERIGSCE